MAQYEYKVIAAPKQGVKAKGLRAAEDRFARTLETLLNTHAADGWDYLRTETLPCEEREGLMSKTTVFQNMMIFRRVLTDEVVTPEAEPITPTLITHHTVATAPAEEGRITTDEAPAETTKE